MAPSMRAMRAFSGPGLTRAAQVCHRTASPAIIPAPRWRPAAVPPERHFEQRRHRSTTANPPQFAFAFDIDGVLLHVAKPIPGATQTLSFLQRNAIPFILLTNGGGRHETARVADLSAKLGVPLTTANFVQSHTPFQNLCRQGGELHGSDKTVLVTGSDAAQAREIAHRYGFKNVVIPADLLAACPGIWPFEPLMEEVYKSTARPLPKGLHGHNSSLPDTDALKIDAILVFNDPRDWALDIQLIVDLLLSREGYLGTYSRKNKKGKWQSDGQPELWFSNGDLTWSTTHHLPRLAQGAFQAAVAGVWARITGGVELRRRVIGKPAAETYEFAEKVLAKHRGEMLGEEGVGRLESVYMVGDNPESDIAGANGFESLVGTTWHSVLVRTGVWDEGRGPPAHSPMAIKGDVKEAVQWALRRERWIGEELE